MTTHAPKRDVENADEHASGRALEHAKTHSLGMARCPRMACSPGYYEAHSDYDSFYEQTPVPDDATEGEILSVSYDGKGVPLTKTEAEKLKAKNGAERAKTKEALVGVCYTVDPKPRTPEELAENLLDPQAARERRRQEGRTDDGPKAKNIRRFASLTRTKEEVIDVIKADAERRDPQHRKRLAVLLDGALCLWKLTAKKFSAWANVNFILDIIHVVGYLWLAAGALFEDTDSSEAKQWVREKLTEILRGRVGYVIGALRQMHKKTKLTDAKRATLQQVVTYFVNHKQWMQYDKYLALGLPVATSLAESTCGFLIKRRMTGDGKHWGLSGGEAILVLRSLKTSNDNDLRRYWSHRARFEKLRRYDSGPNYTPHADLRLVA